MTDVHSKGLTNVDVLRGLLYSHDRANANTSVLHQASATLDAVVEVLMAEGVLDPATLDERRDAAEKRREREFYERGMAVALQEFDGGKYEFDGGAEIDCESRLEHCGAACCKLPLALSREDIEEGVLRWDLGRPLHDRPGTRRLLRAHGPLHGALQRLMSSGRSRAAATTAATTAGSGSTSSAGS